MREEDLDIEGKGERRGGGGISMDERSRRGLEKDEKGNGGVAQEGEGEGEGGERDALVKKGIDDREG